MNTYTHDKAVGDISERIVLDILQKKYPDAYILDDYCKECDIIVPNEFAVEVKYDNKYQQTGNVVVEIWMNGSTSGLLTSTATWWVFHLDDELVWILREKIIEMILLEQLHWVQFTGAGDYAPKKAYLVKVWMLKKYAEYRTNCQGEII